MQWKQRRYHGTLPAAPAVVMKNDEKFALVTLFLYLWRSQTDASVAQLDRATVF